MGKKAADSPTDLVMASDVLALANDLVTTTRRACCLDWRPDLLERVRLVGKDLAVFAEEMDRNWREQNPHAAEEQPRLGHKTLRKK